MVNKVSVGGSPAGGVGEQEELGLLYPAMSFPGTPDCSCRGVLSTEVPGVSRWEHHAGAPGTPLQWGVVSSPSPGCCGLGLALSGPAGVWVFWEEGNGDRSTFPVVPKDLIFPPHLQ